MEEPGFAVRRAKHAKEMVRNLWPIFVPIGLLGRIEAAREAWSKKSPAEWDEEWQLQREPMRELVRDLEGWMAMTDWTMPLQGCSDTLLLFYTLRILRAGRDLESLPDEQFVPGELVPFWRWTMRVRPQENWTEWKD